MAKNILIAGLPRSGKTTLLQKIISSYPKKVGFLTKEIRNTEGNRTGFLLETSTGNSIPIASIETPSEYKVSKYFVSKENLEALLPEVASFDPQDFLYIDEIGEMELLSEKVKSLILSYLDAPNTCIATISNVYEDALIQGTKDRSDILLLTLTEENRDEIEKTIYELLLNSV
jgi:nucleoside-triphosphatase THEP1